MHIELILRIEFPITLTALVISVIVAVAVVVATHTVGATRVAFPFSPLVGAEASIATPLTTLRT